MDSPFFGSQYPWSPADYSHLRPKPQRWHRPVAQPAKPKVVSIPVEFVGSDDHPKIVPAPPTRTEREKAAVARLQRVARGFLVRKNLKVLRKLEKEVDDIELRIRVEEDLIRLEEKERLRANEMLMRLLLRLDSVRGAREYRKRLIRRVVALQEAVDSLVGAVQSSELVEEAGDQSPKSPDEESTAVIEGSEGSASNLGEETLDQAPLQNLSEEEDVAKGSKPEEVKEESPESGDDIGAVPTEGSLAVEVAEEKGTASMKEVMERAAAETGRLNAIVAELCERSARQCRIMSGLVQRVENLERAVQRMEAQRRKKKPKCHNRL